MLRRKRIFTVAAQTRLKMLQYLKARSDVSKVEIPENLPGTITFKCSDKVYCDILSTVNGTMIGGLVYVMSMESPRDWVVENGYVMEKVR